MGAPTSSILSEIHLQYLENTKIFDILKSQQLIGYFRYVDDILIIYKDNLIDIHETLTLFNNISPTLTFTMEKEVDNRISFPDINIYKADNNISFNIYRKLTVTDTIILRDSCHPNEHKMATIKIPGKPHYHISHERVNINTEYDVAKQILLNNQYDPKMLDKAINKIKSNIKDKWDNNESTTIQALPKTEWAKFTHVGKQIRVITKLFGNTDIKISFTTENTIGRILMPEKDPYYNKFSKSGVYQLTCRGCNKKYIVTCQGCNKKYIGQTANCLKKDSKSILEIINKKMVN